MVTCGFYLFPVTVQNNIPSVQWIKVLFDITEMIYSANVKTVKKNINK